jgi:preprotein translocase subunit SecA
VKFETVSMLSKVSIRTQEEIDREEEERRERLMRALQAQHAEMASALAPGEQQQGGAPAQAQDPQRAAAGGYSQGDAQGTLVRSDRKVGRNEPCPCGSGKKFKHCHGALSSVE